MWQASCHYSKKKKHPARGALASYLRWMEELNGVQGSWGGVGWAAAVALCVTAHISSGGAGTRGGRGEPITKLIK